MHLKLDVNCFLKYCYSINYCLLNSEKMLYDVENAKINEPFRCTEHAQTDEDVLFRLSSFSFSAAHFISAKTLKVCLGSLTVTCRTCNPEVTRGRRFDSAPGHRRVTTLGKLFTHMCLCHQAV